MREDESQSMNPVTSLHYAVSEWAKHWNDWQWYHDRYCDYVMGPLHRKIYPRYKNATRVMEQNWDNLIVFDACRHDLFEEFIDITQFDQYDTKISLGSNTGEWTIRNFRDEDYKTRFGDTVYVTGNISVSRRITGQNFHEIYNVWEDHFDEELGAVPPETVIETARRARREHPNKRLVIHILQPHCPFIARDGAGGYTNEVFDPPNEQKTSYIWHDLAQGNVNLNSLVEAYGETLRIGWEETEPLLEELDGRTAVTSDHGNMYGERPWPYLMPVYAHPTKTRPDGLVRVPWGIIEADDERPEITDEGVQGRSENDEIDEQILQDQLEALGYA